MDTKPETLNIAQEIARVLAEDTGRAVRKVVSVEILRTPFTARIDFDEGDPLTVTGKFAADLARAARGS